jgi:mannose-6-phosphate isomerase-like protein (cupin superfamily)
VKRYSVARLDELDRIPVAHGLEWRPVRRRFGIGSFGINAYTAEKPGDWVVEEHKEGSGHEELYVVVRGRARFTLDGEDLDAPAGTIVFLPDSDVRRVAIAEDPETTVLAIGGWAGRAFEPSGWEWRFEANARVVEGDSEGAMAIMADWLDDHPDDPRAIYNLACLECLLGRNDDSLTHLRRALELEPELEKWAREDPDLEPIREAL